MRQKAKCSNGPRPLQKEARSGDGGSEAKSPPRASVALDMIYVGGLVLDLNL